MVRKISRKIKPLRNDLKSNLNSSLKRRWKDSYFIHLIILVVIIIIFLIIKPFISPILLGIIFAISLLPLTKLVNRIIKNWTLSSVFVLLIFILVIFGFIVILSTVLINKAVSFYNIISTINYDIIIYCNYSSNIMKTGCETIKNNFGALLTTLGKGVISILYTLISSIPQLIFNTIIIIFVIFFSLKEKDKIKKYLYRLPFKKDKMNYIIGRIKTAVISVIYGNIISAIGQSFFATLGFIIFGVPNAIIFGLLVFPASFIPIIGTGIVWGPIVLYLFIRGLMLNNIQLVICSIILLVYSAIIVSGVDNLIKSLLIGKKTKYNPVIILISILGGIALFGVSGVFIGPVLVIVGLEILNSYLKLS